jgi:transposase-like protein
MALTEIMKKEMELVSTERSDGERSEPSRSGVEANSIGPATPADPEVESKPRRRQFSAEYKRRILEATDHGGEGDIGGLLRREGLYSSHLTAWRRQRERAEIAGLEPKKRGKKAAPKNPLADDMHRLTRENKRLKEQLRKAEIIIDVQKKLCDVLGLTVPPIETNEDGE